MLPWRLLLGALSIAAMIGLCWLDHSASVPGIWLIPLAIVAAVLATQEVLDMAAIAQMRPLRWTVYVGVVLVVCSSWIDGLERTVLSTSLVGYYLFCLRPVVLPLLAIAILLVLFGEMWRYQRPGGNMANLAAGVFPLIYVGLMLNFAVNLRMIGGVAALASWIIVVKLGDTGAYAVGRLIGRHKMAPLISPGKTIEGGVGALGFSCLGSWLAFRWLVPLMLPEELMVPWRPWWGWIAFGLLVGGAGMVGDLAESLLKRDVGVKDSSTWMPGFGGVLDMIDSLLLAAPVAWFCWATGLVGR